MQKLEVRPWEASHPLNGNPCPVTGRSVYIESKWKVTRPDYRLRTGILEPGVVISLPVGYTKIQDTHSFFEILSLIKQSPHLNAERFVLIEDYTFHTGSDYEGRLTYIKRMVEEFNPIGVVFVTQSMNWKLSIKMAQVISGSTFPIKHVNTYWEAIQFASDVLGRPVAGHTMVKTRDRLEKQNFRMAVEIKSVDCAIVKYNGCPDYGNLPLITDFYRGLLDHPRLSNNFSIVHDFSEMRLPPLVVLWKLIRIILSDLCNFNESRIVVTGKSLVFRGLIFLEKTVYSAFRKTIVYISSDKALLKMDAEMDPETLLAARIQMDALDMLDKIAWHKPGYYELERISDPHLKPLALMLGALKQDVDYYLGEREKELVQLEDAHNRALQLSIEIERAYTHSEEDRMRSEELSKNNLELSIEISQSQKEVFLVLADYIDKRAKIPEKYTRRLAMFVKKIAPLFRYNAEDADRLHDAILLFHVGYLGTPETEQDKAAHCQVGGEILGNIYSFLMQYAAQAARSHHEKWNGTGFPDQLIGDRIPREARLLALSEFIMNHPDEHLDYRLAIEAGVSLDPAMVSIANAHYSTILNWKNECVQSYV